jgi:hypothetical protein
MAENSAEHSGGAGPQPQFELPKVQDKGLERQTEQAIEKRQVSEGASSAPPAQAPSVQQIPIQSQPSGYQLTAGLPAKDADLIEKQWVDRAKAIVDQTQDDPFRQNKEMSKMKADYIKKRFNKSIPVEDPKKQ